MVSASFISTCALVLAVFQSVVGDVITVPALGIANGGVDVTEDDVQPFTGFNTPCGTIDVAKNIDTSTAVPINADNTINVIGHSFAAGADGSTAVTATVDTTGTGNSFLAPLQIQQNGNAIQAIAGSTQPIVAVMPDNTTCTGGAAKDLCLVQFMTAGGFSNCVVAQQGAANSTAGSASASNSTASASDSSASASNSTASASNSTAAASTGKASKSSSSKSSKGAAVAASGKAVKAATKGAKVVKIAKGLKLKSRM